MLRLTYFIVVLYIGFTNCLKITNTVSKSCIVDTDQGRLDLTPLASKDDAAFKATQPATSDTVLWNPCYDVRPSQCDSAAEFFISVQPIDTQDQNCVALAKKDDSSFVVKDGQLMLKYKYESTGPAAFIDVVFECNEETTASFTVTDGQDVFSAKLSGKAVCFQAIAPPSGSHGLSIGSVLLIIALVSVVLYIVVGILICKFVKKAQGAEVIPQVEFWKDLPFKVKDGFKFVVSGCKPKGSYDNMTVYNC